MPKRLLLPFLLIAGTAFAQFNAQRGHSAPAMSKVMMDEKAADGTVMRVEREVAPKMDSHGNAAGSTYDLAVDGAFDGQTVLVVDLYGQDFSRAAGALKQKGFSTVRYQSVPSVLIRSNRSASSLEIKLAPTRPSASLNPLTRNATSRRIDMFAP